MHLRGLIAAITVVATAGVGAGCSRDPRLAPLDAGPRDLTILFETVDLAGADLGQLPEHNECGDNNPTCIAKSLGPPFVLQSDPMPSPDERDTGVRRDNEGALVLDQVHAGFDKLWIANPYDAAGLGTVSKVDAQAVREVARYPTVTCSSLKTGSRMACDGETGCCTLDDWFRWQARKSKQPEPGHQAVQLAGNSPSRTGVDFNGDLFIANRAFGVQSSVTKIAANLGSCIDRNGNGRIDTSADTNSDGAIDIDCNGDKVPDDIDNVRMTPCTNGLKQEFYGLDDECVLWTTNTFEAMATGRPLALGSVDKNNPWGSTATVWAGSYRLAKFVRVDGNSGRYLNDVQLSNQCNPYGAAIDGSGVLWATPLGSGKLCYLDSLKPDDARTGIARDPDKGMANGYGIAVDRDQNVWLGYGVMRYTPDRSKGWNSIGSGWWLRVENASGVGIAADSRNDKDYFVWACLGGSVLRIPGSQLPRMKMDTTVSYFGWEQIKMACYGVGVDAQQNVWGVSHGLTTRALVDGKGAITQPDANSPPKPNKVCPAGDTCKNPGAYTYSDFTGFGFRNFTAPRGVYGLVIHSECPRMNPTWGTRWVRVEWDGELPPNTSLAAKARAGASPAPDGTWDDWQPGSGSSPLDLSGFGDLPHLEVEFDFKTNDAAKSPRLKSARVFYECLYEG